VSDLNGVTGMAIIRARCVSTRMRHTAWKF